MVKMLETCVQLVEVRVYEHALVTSIKDARVGVV